MRRHGPGLRAHKAKRPGRNRSGQASRAALCKTTAGDTVRNSTRPVAPRKPRRPAAPKLLSAPTLVHYSLHFVFPAVLTLVFFPLCGKLPT